MKIDRVSIIKHVLLDAHLEDGLALRDREIHAQQLAVKISVAIAQAEGVKVTE